MKNEEKQKSEEKINIETKDTNNSTTKEIENIGQKIQRDISLQAHKYFRENTKILSNFKKSDTNKSTNSTIYKHCGKTSEKPLYSPKRDLVRLRDDDDTKADEDENLKSDEVQFNNSCYA